jgi:integrase
MPHSLIARAVERLKPAARQYDVWDSSLPGFGLRVSVNGRKTWTVRYRIGRRLRRMTLGHFPPLTLADARKDARTALRSAEKGIDPAEAKIERRDADTFGELAAEYVERHAKRRKKSWKADDRMLRTEVLPHWRHRLARDISRRDVRTLVENIAERGAPILANRVVSLLSRVFKFALDEELIEASPAVRVSRPGQERSRDRVLTDDEIRQFWTAVAELPSEMAAFWKLRFLSAQRGGECVAMRWSDVDLEAGWWIIPATVAKNKREHRVPLSESALTILKDLRAAVDERLQQPRADGQPRKEPVYVLAGARGKRQQADAAATFGVADFRGHDLRRTAATNMRKVGVPRDHVSKVLNHVEGGPAATRVYDRYDGDREKKIALDTWARTLTAILEQEAGAKVIQFGTR